MVFLLVVYIIGIEFKFVCWCLFDVVLYVNEFWVFIGGFLVDGVVYVVVDVVECFDECVDWLCVGLEDGCCVDVCIVVVYFV